MADPSTHEVGRIRAYFGEASWRPSAGRGLLVAERRRLVEQVVREMLATPLPQLTVCDVGCGSGADLERWRSLGVTEERIFGTELVRARADEARRALPGATIESVDGFQLPFADASFDLVTASLVLSTTRDGDNRRQLASEMWRVTRAGGILAIYDFTIRKPWNRNVVAIRRAELAGALGRPLATHRLAPFLPLLDFALKLPFPLRSALLGVLPRTHRLWVWQRPPQALRKT